MLAPFLTVDSELKHINICIDAFMKRVNRNRACSYNLPDQGQNTNIFTGYYNLRNPGIDMLLFI